MPKYLSVDTINIGVRMFSLIRMTAVVHHHADGHRHYGTFALLARLWLQLVLIHLFPSYIYR